MVVLSNGHPGAWARVTHRRTHVTGKYPPRASRRSLDPSTTMGVELRLKAGGALPPVSSDRVVVGVCDIAGAGVRALLGRGLHSFPFPLNLSLLCPFPLDLSVRCPPYNPS